MTCTASAVPTLVRTEGLAERMGDILLQCSGGTAGSAMSGNLNIFLPVNITNRISADGTATDVSLAIDSGASPPPTPVPGRVSSQSISFNGISFTVPAAGGVNMRVSNLRANVNQLGAGSQEPVRAYLAANLNSVALSNNPVVVGRPARGLLATQASSVIRCGNSPLPTGSGLKALFAAGTTFASTRVTEGFPEAFQVKDAASDTGTRIMVRYTGVPAGVLIFVPDVVAGADAAQPTAGGDLGGTQSGGQYVPGSGALLLSRVLYGDSSGGGGRPVYAPGAPVSFDGASEVPVANGTGFAVYEVMDASPLRAQTAQFPTFVAVTGLNAGAAIQQAVLPAPVSTEAAASPSAPIPRFAAVEPASDCPALGDCNSDYFPRLYVFAQPLLFAAIAGGTGFERGYIAVNNKGGGVMNWTATVTYKSGADWLRLDNTSGVNNLSIFVYPSAVKLAPGTYEATITIDAGTLAGTVNLPVVLRVAALPPPQPPTPAQPKFTVTSFTNAANFLFAPVAPGSLATIKGTNLAGTSVAVTFDGLPARLLYTSDTQINLQVPAGLGSKTSAQMVVTVDGTAGPAQTVALAPVAPAVFTGGVLDQDGTANGAAAPAAPGSVIQIFATGLAAAGDQVTVKIHDRDNLLPVYAGPAPGLDGVEQINVAVPGDLPAMLTSVLVCAPSGSQRVCSHPAPLVLGEKP